MYRCMYGHVTHGDLKSISLKSLYIIDMVISSSCTLITGLLNTDV